MTFSEVRQYVKGVLKNAFGNKTTLDKISESEGELLFNNQALDYRLEGSIPKAEIYDETETIVGRWKNGKPIYQKTIFLGNGPAKDSTIYFNYANVGVADLEEIIDQILFCGTGSTNWNSAGDGVNDLSLWTDIANKRLALSTSVSGYTPHDDIWVTLKYTKTIDAQNSFALTMLTDTYTQPSVVSLTADNYSTTERVVGTTAEGRPIYQKTISCNKAGTVSNSIYYYTFTLTELGISDLKDVLYAEYIASSTGNDGWYTCAACSQIWYNVSQSRVDFYTFHKEVLKNITIKYTKTTDSANQLCTPRLDNYSTSEQICGTWIDGKSLYQRTIPAFKTTSANHKVLVSGVNSANVKKVDGYVIYSNNAVANINYYAPDDLNNNILTYIEYISTTNCNIVVDSGQNAIGGTIYVTIQYTK